MVMEHIRMPAVAGSFYPADPGRLRFMVDGFVGEARKAVPAVNPPPRAVIVPHAGYVYSGATAALGYAALTAAGADVRHVVVIGPCHYVGVRGIALPDADYLRTPLGDIPVWEEGVSTAVASCMEVLINDAVHEQEHSIEVQLPFLQRVLPDADVLPLAAGWVEPELVADVIEACLEEPYSAVVISSDLSHYHTYEQARQIDRETIDNILALRPVDHDHACGATGVDGMLDAATRCGLVPRLLGACNSGDTAGDRSRVVGYASVAFDGEPDDEFA